MNQRNSIKEFTTLIFRQKEQYVSYDEFFSLMNKLNVTDDPESALQLFRLLDPNATNYLAIQGYFKFTFKCKLDLQTFLSYDITKINLLELEQTELVLRVALEIFHHLSQDSFELELKKTMAFVKLHFKEQIDFLETMEMFGFVQDIVLGSILTKVSLQNFFRKAAPQLRNSLSLVILRKIQSFLTDRQKAQLHSRNNNSLETLQRVLLRSHSRHSNEPSRFSSPFNTLQNDSQKSDIERLLQKKFNLNLEVELEDDVGQQSQQDLNNLLKENRPKQRGWLQRLSLNKANKWSLLFFQIDSTKTLRAIKPSGVKKQIEITPCEFFCLFESQNNQSEISNKSSRIIDLDSQIPILLVVNEPKNSKSMLVKAQDLKEVLQIIKEIKKISTRKSTQKTFSDEQLTFSSICDFAFMNRIGEKDKDKVRQKMKSLEFKEYFLVIREGKLILYNSVLKHKFDLQNIAINQNQKGLAFIPSHPYSFQLILQDQKKQTEVQQQSYLQVKPQQQESFWEEEPAQEEQGSVIMWQIDEDEAEYSEQDSKQHRPQQEKKGLFDQLMDKFKKKPEIKQVKITLAAESEMKRRQWIYSINYYRTYQDFNSNKSSQISHHFTPIPSQYHGQSTPLRSSFFRSSVNNTNVKQFNTFNNCVNSQVFLGGNHTHINMNVGFFNLGSDDDYYDVFKDQSIQLKDSRQISRPDKPNYCHTDPNEPRKDPEYERLVTQPSKDFPKRQQLPVQKMMKSEIKSTSSIELWQKFLICFFRYISTQQKPQSFVSQRGDQQFLTQQSQQQISFQQQQQHYVHQQVIAQQQNNQQQMQAQIVSKDLEESQEPKVQRLYSRKLYVNKPK